MNDNNSEWSSESSSPPPANSSLDVTVSSTPYALRCKEFLGLLKDLTNLGYVPLTQAHQFHTESFTPVRVCSLIYLASLLSVDNQVHK